MDGPRWFGHSGHVPPRSSIDVFAYREYRAFLADSYAAKKREERGFSYRVFARRANLRSPNYLKLVIDGQRNLSDEMAERFGVALGLKGDGLDYFCALVAFNQGRSTEARARHYQRMRNFNGYRRAHVLDATYEAYFSRWYIPAIRELAACRGFQSDPAWIAARLKPQISLREAREGVRVLQELQLLVEDEAGNLRQSEPILTTPQDAVLGHHIAAYHRALLERASASIDLIHRDERELGAVTLSLSKVRAAELKRELATFRDSILQRYGADADGTRVVQMCFQMFPLSSEEE